LRLTSKVPVQTVWADPESCVLQDAEARPEPQKNPGRYNLRRRKTDDKDAEPRPQEEEEVKWAAMAPPTTVSSTPLDFGGRIGRLEGKMGEGGGGGGII